MGMTPHRPGSTPALLAAALVVLVVAVYWGAGDLGFVEFDDPGYVSANPLVQRGLTAEGIRMSFTRFEMANWHPLTWLSLMLDVEVFGTGPRWLHRVNVAWHAVDAVLLFGWLFLATGAAWRSALVGALFAVHPLHVESVAWISERKDVLSTFFLLLTLLSYRAWVLRGGTARYLLLALWLALGLMTKPMLVTLPALLLLVDVWPLERIRPGSLCWERAWPLIREKLPLFALAAGSSIITILAQDRAREGTDRLGLSARLANAAVAAATYLWKAVAPNDLAAYYPHEWLVGSGAPSWKIALSVLLLAAISAVTLWQWRPRPFLAVGWLWYLGTLVPVIGIVQVGTQGMADRYTYVPLIGVFAMLAWSLPGTETASRSFRFALVAAAGAFLLAFCAMARAQVSTWKDTLALFEHAASVDPRNWLAWKNLGAEQYRRGWLRDASESFRAAVRAKPWDPDLWVNLGRVQLDTGEHAPAAESFERAIRLAPEDEEAWYGLAIAYAWLERPDRVRGLVERLRRIDPERAARLEQRIRRPEGPAGGR